MCYNVNFLTKKRLEYAKRLKGLIRQEDIDPVFDALEAHTPGAYYTTGFDHPDLPVITNEDPKTIQLLGWGLIPFWVKDPTQAIALSNKTLNARGEEMFDKPSFRNAAKSNRCLIMVDGFFEYHWQKGKSYPYYIRLKSGEPMLLGGLWETWHYKQEQITRRTCSIVTTRANDLMRFIHNNPKSSEGPRMPLIVPREIESEWLSERSDPVSIKDIVGPYDDAGLEGFTVPRLKGKEGVGNSSAAVQPYTYSELSTLF